MSGRTLVLAVFAGVLGLDITTKAWAVAVLTDPVRIADWIYLMLRHNSGIFFGTVPVSVGYWMCVCTALVWFGWRALCTKSTPLSVCLAAILAGLVGNAIGQVRGAVVDFIGFGPVTGNAWLVVNFADLAMVAGTLALAFFLVFGRARPAHRSCRCSPTRSPSLVPRLCQGLTRLRPAAGIPQKRRP